MSRGRRSWIVVMVCSGVALWLGCGPQTPPAKQKTEVASPRREEDRTGAGVRAAVAEAGRRKGVAQGEGGRASTVQDASRGEGEAGGEGSCDGDTQRGDARPRNLWETAKPIGKPVEKGPEAETPKAEKPKEKPIEAEPPKQEKTTTIEVKSPKQENATTVEAEMPKQEKATTVEAEMPKQEKASTSSFTTAGACGGAEGRDERHRPR